MDDVKLAQGVYDALSALQRAIHEAHRAGLRVDASIEQIGDCVGLRKRPEITVEVCRPLRATVPHRSEGIRVYPANTCEVGQYTTLESLINNHTVETIPGVRRVMPRSSRVFEFDKDANHFKRIE